MNKTLPALLAAGAALLAAVPAQAQTTPAPSPWMVRARIVNLDTANRSDAVPALALAADQITVNSKAIPEFDISYFFTPNIAAELVLTVPQKHTVSVAGASVGTFKHLPPTLLLQYHFMPDAKVSPYIGAGVNYTRISNVSLAGGLGLENNSTGLALQAGVNFRLDRHWSLNVDVKKGLIRSDVFAAGARISRVEIDPVLFGVGVGYRF